MPQEFQVLRCFNCEKFQVHQTKKAKKWICKVCGEKQSYIRIYFTGPATHCRSIVQESNFKAGEQKISQMLAESPNYIPENNQFEDEIGDELSHASKKFKSETSIARKDLQLNLACFPEEENSFSDESCGADHCCKEINVNLDLLQKQSLTTENTTLKPGVSLESNSKELPPPSDYLKRDFCQKPEVLKTKPHIVKNRGFQKILKAAGKFN